MKSFYKTFLIFPIALCLITDASSQVPSLEWAKNIGGYSGNVFGHSIELDSSDNLYTVGSFSRRVDFDPGIGTHYLYTDSNESNIFISKTDAAGNFAWARQLQISLSFLKFSISVNPMNSDVAITGVFKDTVDFDPGPGINNLVAVNGYDIFILLLDSAGNFEWVKRVGGSYDDFATSITIDNSSNLIVAGHFQGLVDFDPGAGTYYLNNIGLGTTDGFVLKLTPAGGFTWAKQFMGQSASSETCKSVTSDWQGGILVLGKFGGISDFDPSTSTYYMTADSIYKDIFVCKLNNLGNFVWAKKIGGNLTEDPNSVITDGLINVYVTGSYYDTVDFDPGPGIYNLSAPDGHAMFILKFDYFGNFTWVNQFEASTFDNNKILKADAAANIYVTGYFYNITDFDPGAGTFNLTSTSGANTFVLKLSSSGSFVWVKQFGGMPLSTSGGFSIDVGNSGNVYSVGYFDGLIDFNPDTSVTYNLSSLVPSLYMSRLNVNGDFAWAENIGEGAGTYATSTAVDLSGNIYTIGYFYGIVDFDPGGSVYYMINNAAQSNMTDIFISKLDSSGNFLWAKQIGGNAEDHANAVCVDAAGNVYITGYYNDIVDFDPGTGVFNLTAPVNGNIFVSKLDASGNFVWAKDIGGNCGYSITTDIYGNVFIAGNNYTASNDYQIYIAKLDMPGNLLWTKSIGNTTRDEGYSIAADYQGHTYITGLFEGTVDFNPGAGTYNLTSAGGYDVFVLKLDGSANFKWAKQFGSLTQNDVGNSIAVNSSGSVYTSGYFGDIADFDPGPGTFNLTAVGSLRDVFISRLDSAGNFVWAKRIGGVSDEEGKSIALDASDNVYLTGEFDGTADFDPGAGTANMTPVGTDVFISKLNGSGNFVWALQLSGISTEYAKSITVDLLGNIYTSGYFYKTMDFDPGPGVSNIIAYGSPDAFVHKMSQCSISSATITPSGTVAICSGDSVVLSTNTAPGFNYQWRKNGVVIPGATSSSYIATAAGNYSVLITSSCDSDTSIAVNVTVNTLPNASITASGPTTFCAGGSVALNAIITANRTYQWKKNGINIPGATSPSYVATTSGTYKVTVTNTITGCTKTTGIGIVVTKNILPAATITPSDTIVICEEQIALLTANSGAGLTYKWKKNGNYISGAAAQTYTVSTAGNYRVEVTNSNGCSKTSLSVTVTIPCKEGTSHSESHFEVSVYPNPSSGDFIFEIFAPTDENISIAVFDAIGELVLSEANLNSQFTLTSGETQLSPGIYSVIVATGLQRKILRIVKTE